MKSRNVFLMFQCFVLATCMVFTLTAQTAAAENTIRYSCSAQVNEAFGPDFIEAFTKESGITVETYISSSQSAVHRLFSDFSDIASTTERIYHRYNEYGYVQTPFCRDPLAIVVNATCSVDNLSEAQVKAVFNKTITNWKELGGPDKRIIVIIPGLRTGAFNNFEKQIMSRRELQYDFTAYRSTRVLDAVERFPEMISFIGYGATKGRDRVKTLSVNHHAPSETRYPYYQIYSFVSRGNPTGAVHEMIQFFLSPKGRDLIKAHGMKPIR